MYSLSYNIFEIACGNRRIHINTRPSTELHFEPSLNLICGPSGSGKTTFLRALMGLHLDYINFRGEIAYNGSVITPDALLKEHVFFVSQGPPSISVTVRVLLDFFSRPDPALREEVLDELFQGDNVRAMTVDTLSIGQRARVWIAAALLSNRGVIVLDEPFAALDLASATRVLGLVTQFSRERIFLMTDHSGILSDYGILRQIKNISISLDARM